MAGRKSFNQTRCSFKNIRSQTTLPVFNQIDSEVFFVNGNVLMLSDSLRQRIRDFSACGVIGMNHPALTVTAFLSQMVIGPVSRAGKFNAHVDQPFDCSFAVFNRKANRLLIANAVAHL